MRVYDLRVGEPRALQPPGEGQRGRIGVGPWLSWKEHPPAKRKDRGSRPLGPVRSISF